MSPQDPSPCPPIKESFEMANQAGNFTEPVISPTTAEQGSDLSGAYFASAVAPQAPEDPGDHHSTQMEDPAQAYSAELSFSEPGANSGLDEDQLFVSETDAILKLPRYISVALYVVDLHPLAIENVSNLLDLFSSMGNVSVIKVIPKPPGTPGIPFCSAYVNYHTVEDACRAWQTLNYHVWMDQPMRIMFSNLDPATRYNEDANIIVTDLEESIDSKFLHERFCKHGAVVSSKVAVDSNGKSTGRAFIQFEDAIDAKRAIEVMNNEKLRGKKVYVGPFIRRQVHMEAEEMNKNPSDLNPAHNPPEEVAIASQNLKYESHPIGKIGSRDILLGSSSTSGNRARDLRLGTSGSPAHGSHDLRPEHKFLKVHTSSGKATSNATMPADMEETNGQALWRQGGREAKERERNLRRGSKASRNLARKRFRLRQHISKEKLLSSEYSSQILVDLSPLSSEPWPPQPWSFETLKDKLTNSYCPEERLAMLGATLFPLVARHTKTLVSDVTNLLVNLDLVEIERIMNLSDEDLHQKVEEVKQDISERVQVFVPPAFVDGHQVAACVEKEPVVLVEELKDLPPPVPARAPTPTPPAPPLLSVTPAPTDPAPSANFTEFSAPTFPAGRGPSAHFTEFSPPNFPAGPGPSANFTELFAPNIPAPGRPEFLQVPALPGLGLRLGIPADVSSPLLPLPFVPHPLAQPWFPESVLNYTGYRPLPGTGFYEPRVSYLGNIYCLAAALARAYQVHEDIPIAAEESADPVEEVAHAERAELMMAAFARVRLAQIVEESPEQMEEWAQEERAQAMEERAQAMEEHAELMMAAITLGGLAQIVDESTEQMEECAQEERAQAVEEPAELMVAAFARVTLAQIVEESAEQMEESAEEERIQAVEESAELMEEVAQEDRAEAVEESAEMNEEIANVEQDNQAWEEFVELVNEVVNEEQAQAEEESAEMKEDVAHPEQANQALKESAELVEEVVDEEQANQAVEESAEPVEEVAHVERVQAVEESAELMVELRHEQQAKQQPQPAQKSVQKEAASEEPAQVEFAQE